MSGDAQTPPSMPDADDGGEARLREAAERYCNWGKWGEDDQVGTLNYITAEMVVEASRLVRRGKVISLLVALDTELQLGSPGVEAADLHTDGEVADALVELGHEALTVEDDDVLFLATQGATQWDALAHIFYDSRMWNGYDCRLVSSMGAERNDIAQYRDRIVGRAVLLDIPRHLGIDWCEPGHAIGPETLEAVIADQGVAVGRGDILLLRFGHNAQCRAAGSWGSYAGGDAPGLGFDTLGWIQDREISAVASDTWGVEVRPNELSFVNQPWHRVALPQMGLCVGEIFDLEALAADCATDGVYEMFFCANPLPVIGSVGGPINPTAIK